jgi:hypothetical protein
MTQIPPSTNPHAARGVDMPIIVDIPPGAGRAYYAARIAAMLRGEPARKPRRPRAPTLATALKQAAKAGRAASALATAATKTSSDENLVNQIAAGSKPALQALFARHRT